MNATDLVTHVQLGDELYPINYDFRVAMKCDSILEDESISDEERACRVTGLLFGIDSPNTIEALEKAGKFLSAIEEVTDSQDKKKLVDFEQHFHLFVSAFKAQYSIDLYRDKLHYHEFVSLLKGLKGQVLNDVIEILEMKPSEEKDHKRRKQIVEAQKKFRIKNKEPKREPLKHAFLDALSDKVKGG